MTRPLVAAVVAVATSAMACSTPGSEGRASIELRGRRVAVARLQDVVQALCEAKAQSSRDLIAAGRTFFDRAHADRHDIAAATGERDRAAAARLHQAKQAVEEDFEKRQASSAVSHLGELVAATRAALDKLSVSTTACDD